jgi:phage terminase large subunit GpA-like protein
MLPSSSESIEAFERSLLDACVLLRPPEKLTIAEWADKYGYLSPEGSAKPGKWYTSNAEYQREPMEVLSPGTGFETVVLMWSSQVGKTQIALWFTAFHMEHDPGPIIFMEPDEGLARMVVQERINPMIRDCPRLAPLFGKQGSKGAGNDIFSKRYPGGQTNFVWASSPLSLAGRPAPWVVSDEYSAYLAGQIKEGSPSKIIRARMATFPRIRRHLKISSPRLRRTCETTADFELSDQRHYYVPCPECGHMQTLYFERLKYIRVSLEPGSYTLEDCWYECEACEYHITEMDKYAMIRQGKWRAHKPGNGDGKTAGFHLSALYSPLGYTWSELIEEYLACEGIPDRLQPFLNTKLGLPWDEQAEGIDLNEVAKGAEPYAAEAPAWVVLVTIGADVQKNRIEATRWGWGMYEQSGALEHRIFMGDPERSDVWAEFDTWRRRQVQHESGLTLPSAVTFVDSGDGNRTAAVYRYTRSRTRQGVFACKGSSSNGAPLANRPRPAGEHKTPLVMVGTSTAKDMIYARLGIVDKDKPGAIHFPDDAESGCDATYFAQLTAEKLVTRKTNRGEESRWECQDGKRNETLDCAVYNFAAFALLRALKGVNMKQLHALLWARVEKLRAAGQLPETPQWKMRGAAAAKLALIGPPSESTESSAQSVSPQPVKKLHKKLRKRIILPNSGWIRGGG